MVIIALPLVCSVQAKNKCLSISLSAKIGQDKVKNYYFSFYRSIMADIKKDSRVTTLTTHVGIRNSLLTILDQLQRCQKSLNEFLEACFLKNTSIINYKSFMV